MSKVKLRRRWEWTVAHVAGAPMSIHASSLGMILLAWGFSLHHTIAVVAANFVSILVLIASHEIGHAWVARRLGLQVIRIRVLFWHGRCEYEAPETRAQAIMIAWGGIGAQSILFILSFALAVAIRELRVDLPSFVSQALFVFGGFNLLMMVLNLIPVRPFDGATAWQFIPEAIARFRSTQTAKASLLRIAQKRRLTSVRGNDHDK